MLSGQLGSEGEGYMIAGNSSVSHGTVWLWVGPAQHARTAHSHSSIIIYICACCSFQAHGVHARIHRKLLLLWLSAKSFHHPCAQPFMCTAEHSVLFGLSVLVLNRAGCICNVLWHGCCPI